LGAEGIQCFSEVCPVTVINIDGQVCLVHLQIDNFYLFLRKQTDKEKNFRLHDEQMVNGLRKIAWTSVFRFPFETTAFIQI
jgi:hypothetical protein